MDEMTKTIIFLLIISGLIASIIEAIKKAISVKQVVKGKERIKTILSRKVIISLSMSSTQYRSSLVAMFSPGN